MKYILASGSPRRKELLKQIIKDFEIIIPNVDENLDIKNPEKLVLELSKLKANSITKYGIIISADTIVVKGDKILGKPKNYNEAFNMLKSLSNSSHFVYTGVCIKNENEIDNFVVKTKIYFRKLSDEEIEKYIKDKSPYDKAGSYGIQETDFCVKIDGSYTNVVGLPTEELRKKLYESIYSKKR
ncbi:Maf family protein [Oceanivirga salmonicida]|uniref:Maf family protein n=1 Tax=Oceanivirga salmonicida TaxID=1769291 RepID=UPI0012E1CA72|nr:Maf family protein [Oceanivirga salmonicida]